VNEDLRHRYAEALRTAADYAIVGEASAPSKMLDAVMAVRDERLNTSLAAYDIVRGQLSAMRKEYSELMGEMLDWRERARKAERSLNLLTAEAPPIPEGTDDDEARRGHAERTVDQWRKYAEHWKMRAEKAEAATVTARDLARDLKAEAQQGLSHEAILNTQAAAWKTSAHTADLFFAALDDQEAASLPPETTASEENT
jgi:chromosome segregation ATPase